MGSCIAEGTRLHAPPTATVTLGAVFHQLQSVTLTDVAQLVVVGDTPIEVHRHHALGPRRDGLFHLINIQLKMFPCWLYQHGHQLVVGNGQDGGDIGVGRHDDLVAILHHAQFLIAAQDQLQGIQPISHRHAMLRADILGVVVLEGLVLMSLQEPSRLDHSPCSGLILLGMLHRDGLKIQ